MGAMSQYNGKGRLSPQAEKTMKQRQSFDDVGGVAVSPTLTPFEDDEGRKVLWWQCPSKLGGGICIYEERARTILHGRKGVQLAASYMVGCEGT